MMDMHDVLMDCPCQETVWDGDESTCPDCGREIEPPAALEPGTYTLLCYACGPAPCKFEMPDILRPTACVACPLGLSPKWKLFDANKTAERWLELGDKND